MSKETEEETLPWTDRECALRETAENHSSDAREYECYSGRYMYGRYVNAMTVEPWAVEDICADMEEQGFGAPATDSLGLNMILYYTDRSQ